MSFRVRNALCIKISFTICRLFGDSVPSPRKNPGEKELGEILIEDSLHLQRSDDPPVA